MKCEACGTHLGEQDWFSAFWLKKNKRVNLCKGCLGEIVFNVLPKVTDTRPGVSGNYKGEISPWQENAIRDMEEGS